MPNAQQQLVISIDGTSASGKSTLSEALAQQLGGQRLEYSLMFRAIAAHMIHEAGYTPIFGTSPSASEIAQAAAYAQHVGTLSWQSFCDIVKDNPQLRSIETSRAAPFFSGLPEILSITDELFIALIDRCPLPVIAEGRTIGRYVYPCADVKLFVDATLFRRAERRFATLQGKGKHEPFEAVLCDLARRDHQDQTRTLQPTGFDPACQIWLDTTIQRIEDTLSDARSIIDRACR